MIDPLCRDLFLGQEREDWRHFVVASVDAVLEVEERGAEYEVLDAVEGDEGKSNLDLLPPALFDCGLIEYNLPLKITLHMNQSYFDINVYFT